MDVSTQAGPTTIVDVQTTGVSWPAIAAGAVAAAALTLALVAFGAGLGLSAISPWSDSGVSASTFKTGTGIYLVVVAVMSSAVGGYLAARLRTRWVGVHSNEVFFRDTAHGFLAWAFATVICATALGAAITHIASGAAAGTRRRGIAGGASDQSIGDLRRQALPCGQRGTCGNAGRSGWGHDRGCRHGACRSSKALDRELPHQPGPQRAG